MTTTHHGFSATRRLILQGAGAVALIGLGTSRSASRRRLPRPTTNIRKMRSSRRARRTRSRRSTASRRGVGQGQARRARDRRDGAVVPIGVSTTLADVTSISFPGQRKSERPGSVLQDSGRHGAERGQSHQDGEDSNVIVVVEAGGKLYSATKEVKVTVGGCGG